MKERVLVYKKNQVCPKCHRCNAVIRKEMMGLYKEGSPDPFTYAPSKLGLMCPDCGHREIIPEPEPE